MFDQLLHRLLKIPYTLHVHRRVKTRRAKITYVFLHGIGTSGAIWEQTVNDVAQKGEASIVVLDLLGFGESPRPEWATYDAQTQARAVAKTLAVLGIGRKVTLVGHSMGALVSIEFARRYPRRVRELVLCSPPLYDDAQARRLPSRDQQLKRAYALASKRPQDLVRASEIAKRYGLIDRALDLREGRLSSYVAALRAVIINQTSLRDIAELPHPITILYGTLDPLVVGARLRKLKKQRTNVRVVRFVGGHEFGARYRRTLESLGNLEMVK